MTEQLFQPERLAMILSSLSSRRSEKADAVNARVTALQREVTGADDLQGLLDTMAALLAGYDAVADRRQRASGPKEWPKRRQRFPSESRLELTAPTLPYLQ